MPSDNTCTRPSASSKFLRFLDGGSFFLVTRVLVHFCLRTKEQIESRSKNSRNSTSFQQTRQYVSHHGLASWLYMASVPPQAKYIQYHPSTLLRPVSSVLCLKLVAVSPSSRFLCSAAPKWHTHPHQNKTTARPSTPPRALRVKFIPPETAFSFPCTLFLSHSVSSLSTFVLFSSLTCALFLSHTAFSLSTFPRLFCPLDTFFSFSLPQTSSDFTPNSPAYNFQPVAMPAAKGCSPESPQALTASSSELEAQQWLADHRFGTFLSLFSSYCGADLLRLSRKDLMDLCGPADGIRLYNTIHSRSDFHSVLTAASCHCFLRSLGV